jgi:hypothetical protein
VLLDTNGNIFGGFTPVEWESRVWNWKYGEESNCRKADGSQKSFLFTLKNPHNIPARRFALKAERKKWAIACDSGWGPCFGPMRSPLRVIFGGGGIAVSDNCNAHTHSGTSLGTCYTNDTGLNGEVVFTGSRNFQVREIEVFEITD